MNDLSHSDPYANDLSARVARIRFLLRATRPEQIGSRSTASLGRQASSGGCSTSCTSEIAKLQAMVSELILLFDDHRKAVDARLDSILDSVNDRVEKAVQARITSIEEPVVFQSTISGNDVAIRSPLGLSKSAGRIVSLAQCDVNP